MDAKTTPKGVTIARDFTTEIVNGKANGSESDPSTFRVTQKDGTVYDSWKEMAQYLRYVFRGEDVPMTSDMYQFHRNNRERVRSPIK